MADHLLTEPALSLIPVSQAVLRALSVSALAEHCTRELNNYRRGEASNDQYAVELLRRATLEGDQDAWQSLHHCLNGIVHNWLRGHPKKEVACRLDSEENYVAQAFERFWQATIRQPLQFSSLAAALRYLRASLNGALLDTLRAYSRVREEALPEPGTPGEPQVEDSTDSGEVWEILKTLLPNVREQRLAYLLFHCGLKPREICHFCPQEFDDIREIYRLRRNIMERLMRNADQIRWRLRGE